MKMLKNNKGITLLSLIIVIIVLIVLTYVTIDILIEDGTIDDTKKIVNQANNEAEASQALENQIMDDYNEKIGETMSGTTVLDVNAKLVYPGERAKKTSLYRNRKRLCSNSKRIYCFKNSFRTDNI